MSDIITNTRLDANGIMHVERVQDVQDILKQNKLEANEGWNESNRDTFGRKVATIPVILLEQWAKEWGVPYAQLLSDPDLKAKMMLKLNAGEYAHLRTHISRI